MSKSKSKTFPKGTDFGEVADWFYENVGSIDHEVIYSGAEPTMDLITETDSKYLITITKIEDDTTRKSSQDSTLRSRES